ncbi:MAG: lipoate--protein ligase family protein [Planctomycetes bacterium]|nr:lipoate--protein ligase family protein [Planctomycetota bacterium]
MRARFLSAATRAPALNLALDAALLEGRAKPTIRLYRWAPTGLSLGRFQPREEIEPLRANLGPHELVRRSTGGRAIWHDARELTFAYVVPAPPRGENVLASFERVHRAILECLSIPGLRFVRDEPALCSDRAGSPWCFERATELCLALDGRKVLGSAQRRSRGWTLHHGSLALPEDCLAPPELEARLARALAQALDCELEPGELLPAEFAHAECLRSTYALGSTL